jgi:porin
MKTTRQPILFSAALLVAASSLATAGEPMSVPVSEAPAADATLFPIPDYTGSLSERSALLGDWGGARTALALRGLQLELSLTSIYQGVWDGGRGSDDWDFSHSADYHLKLDFEKMGLWQGGFLQINGESYFGENVNRRTGTLLPVNNDAIWPLPGDDISALPSVVFTQFLSERFAIFAGKLDTTAGDVNEFAWGKGDEGFMNFGFGFNPVTALTTPYSTLGAGFLFVPNEESYFSVSAYDPNGDPTESGFDSFFDDGVSIAAEGRVGTRFLDKRGHQLLGAIWSNKNYTGLEQDPRLLAGSLLTTGSVASGVQREEDSWAVYYNFDQYLVGGDDGRGLGVFGRAGFADEDTNVVEQFYSLGFGGKGVIPGREDDRFGAGYYYLKYSDQLPGLLSRDDHEQGWELFYDVAVTPWMSIGADVQFVDSPLNDVDTAVVGGLRSQIRF